MKTDINDILKRGADTKVEIVDYSNPKYAKRLKRTMEKAEEVSRSAHLPIPDMDKPFSL